VEYQDVPAASPDTYYETNLAGMWRILVRRLWLIVLTAVLAAGVTGVLVHRKHKHYTATAVVSLAPNTIGLPSLLGVQQSQPAGTSTTAMETAAALAVNPRVATATSKALHGTVSPGNVLAAVSASVSNGGDAAISVQATTPSPAMSMKLANAYAATYVTSENAQYPAAIAAARHRLQGIRASLGGSGVDRMESDQIATQLAELGSLSALTQPVASVGALATTATPTGTSATKAAITAGVIGLLVAICLVFILDRIRPRLYSPESFGGAAGMPVLGLLSAKRGRDAAVARRLLRMATTRRMTVVSAAPGVRVSRLVSTIANVADEHQLRVVLLDLTGRATAKAVRIRPVQQPAELPAPADDQVAASSTPWRIPTSSNGDHFQVLALPEEGLLLSEAARAELEARLLDLRADCDAFLLIADPNLNSDELPVRLNDDDGAVLLASKGVDARVVAATAGSIHRSAATALGVVVADSSR